jgi:4-hydroxy-2-oxoheptanedioate aldolase
MKSQADPETLRDIIRNSIKDKLAAGQVVSSVIVKLVRGVEITPLVRVPNYEPEFVSRTLDGGAMGVIAPHVNSAAVAERVVASAKFPLMGHRSSAGGLPHLHYRSWPIAETYVESKRLPRSTAWTKSLQSKAWIFS